MSSTLQAIMQAITPSSVAGCGPTILPAGEVLERMALPEPGPDITPAPISSPHSGIFGPRPLDYREPIAPLACATNEWFMAEANRWAALRPGDRAFSITFQPNRRGLATDIELSDIEGRKDLLRFDEVMNEHHLGLGHRFRRMTKRRPWLGVIGQRGIGGHLHYHGVAVLPEHMVLPFQQHAPDVWKQITGGGSLVMKRRLDEGWPSYLIRHLETPHRQPVAFHIIPELRHRPA